MADRIDDACEDIVEGACKWSHHFKVKAKEGHATAADVAAALKLLSHMGGELRAEHKDVAMSKDAIMESMADLDLDNLH